jgi:hypothetical protein
LVKITLILGSTENLPADDNYRAINQNIILNNASVEKLDVTEDNLQGNKKGNYAKLQDDV